MERRIEKNALEGGKTPPKIPDVGRHDYGSSGETSGSQGPQVGDKRAAPSSDNKPRARREFYYSRQEEHENEEESFVTRNYADSSSSGEEESHDTIKNIRPHEMSIEQKGIYADYYEIEVDKVPEHWESMQEKRVKYANDYVDVKFEDSPLEILNKVNKGRTRPFGALDAFDEKAQSSHELRKTVGDDHYSSEEERLKEQARQIWNGVAHQADSLLPRNSKTYKQAREAYERGK